MSEQSTSFMQEMSFKKEPRKGQKRVFSRVALNETLKNLNIQLPTGYGKSFVNAGVYSILKKQNRVNRLLVIVPTTAQKDQFIQDGPQDLYDAGAFKKKDQSAAVVDVGFFGLESIKKHRKGEREIFVITAQSLITEGKGSIVRDLMGTGRWMVTVDEYHHYGVEKAWGNSVSSLPCEFLLAMSATPYRKQNDSSFGVPDITVSYREAVEEYAVKPLRGHSYIYRLDLLDYENNIIHMTTDELKSAVGSDGSDAIENFIIERQMRWSPKYIAPLVTIPLERMINQRIKTGYRLQAIVGAMSVSHASMVCEQIKKSFPHLNVDWVGTGINGRKPEENKKIIDKFCPPKNKDTGEREHTIDVLVHVGIAGEGLDSVSVSEVIHLNAASINNSNNQENGRAARYLKGIVGNINFDSSSEYSTKGYIGKKIMDSMDCREPSTEIEDEETKEREKKDREYECLPDEPNIKIYDLDLLSVNSGSPEDIAKLNEDIETVAKSVAGALDMPYYENLIKDTNSDFYKIVAAGYKTIKADQSAQLNEISTVSQWQEHLNGAMSKITGLICDMKMGKDSFQPSSVRGDVKRAIYTKKKIALNGASEKNPASLKRHYDWVKNLETQILNSGSLPLWLR